MNAIFAERDESAVAQRVEGLYASGVVARIAWAEVDVELLRAAVVDFGARLDRVEKSPHRRSGEKG